MAVCIQDAALAPARLYGFRCDAYVLPQSLLGPLDGRGQKRQFLVDRLVADTM